MVQHMVQHRNWARKAYRDRDSSGDQLLSYGKVERHPTVPHFSMCLSPLILVKLIIITLIGGEMIANKF